MPSDFWICGWISAQFCQGVKATKTISWSPPNIQVAHLKLTQRWIYQSSLSPQKKNRPKHKTNPIHMAFPILQNFSTRLWQNGTACTEQNTQQTHYQLHPSTCPVGERLAKASPSPAEGAEPQPGAQPLQCQGAVPKPGTKAACVMWWWKGLIYGSQLRGCSLMSFAVGQRQQENRDVSQRERICCLSADFFTALTLLFTRCLLCAVHFLLPPPLLHLQSTFQRVFGELAPCFKREDCSGREQHSCKSVKVLWMSWW